MENPRTLVLIPAAGLGTRAKMDKNKVLASMGKSSVIEITAGVFQNHPQVDQIRIIARKEELKGMDAIFSDREKWTKLAPMVTGGKERQDSVGNGMMAAQDTPPDYVLVHDGARPHCSPELVARVIDELKKHHAVVPALPIHDTVRKKMDHKTEVLDRENLFRSQTPQGFHWKILLEAHQKARESGKRFTDDAQMVESIGGKIHLIRGEARNLKITEQEDYSLALWLFENQEWGR